MSKKLRINPERVTLARRVQGFTQDEAAKLLGVGKRTYQRLESSDNNTMLSFSELLTLSVSLKQFPAMLLSELPMHFNFFGVPITSAEHFVRVFDNAYKFSIEHIPDDPEIENALIEIRDEHAEIREFAVKNNITGSRRDLDSTVKMRNLFRTTTSNNKVDRLKFFWVPINTCAYEWEENKSSWSFRHEIIAASAYGDEPPVRSYPASDDYWPEMTDTHEGEVYVTPQRHSPGISDEVFASQALSALPEITVSDPVNKSGSSKDFVELDPASNAGYDVPPDEGFAFKSAQEAASSGSVASGAEVQEKDEGT